VVEQLPHGHAGPRGRHAGHALPDRVVESQAAVADESQRDRAAERLGDARDAHVLRRAWRALTPDVRATLPGAARSIAAREL